MEEVEVEAVASLVDPYLEVAEDASPVVEVLKILGVDGGAHPFEEAQVVHRVGQVESCEDRPCPLVEDHQTWVGVGVETLYPLA